MRRPRKILSRVSSAIRHLLTPKSMDVEAAVRMTEAILEAIEIESDRETTEAEVMSALFAVMDHKLTEFREFQEPDDRIDNGLELEWIVELLAARHGVTKH